MITRAEFVERRQQLEEFNRWERSQPCQEYSPDDAIDNVGTILEWIPASPEDADPDRAGVRRMHALIGLLDRE